MVSRKNMNIAFLVLAMAGSQVSAGNTDYLAQAKQKASDVRDWSVQAADKVREKANSAYGVAREKANNAYAITSQKARALYEKAKEHKKLIAGAAAYLMFEAIGCYNGWRTPFYRLFVLPSRLDANIANLNGQLNNAHNVTIPGLNNQIGNLNGQLNNAQANIANLNNVVLPNLNNQIGNLRNAHQHAQHQAQQLRAELQAAEQERIATENEFERGLEEHLDHIDQLKALQEQINVTNAHIAHLERQNELTALGFGIAAKNVGEQIGQLNAQLDNKDAQINQINKDNAARIQIQERLLREDREESHRRAFEQGRAQAILDHEHGAILQVFNNLEYALQVGQDPIGIIHNLMLQAPRLEFCSKLAAYTNQPEKLSNTFNRLVSLTQNTIDCVINHINGALISLENNVKTMHFTRITADNFEQNRAYIYSVIHNYFGQLNHAFGQLDMLIGFSANNQIIQSHLANCDAHSILQALGAMLTTSLEKAQQVCVWQNGNIIVKSHDDAFNLYVHSEVAHKAYQSYMHCWNMMRADEYPAWVNEFKTGLDVINTCICNGLVQVEEPFNGVSSFSNISQLNSSYDSMSSTSFIDLNQFANEFFNNPVQSIVKIDELKQSLIGGSHFGNSSIMSSSMSRSTHKANSASCINLDDLWKLMGLEKDRNDFLNSNVGSSSMAQSTNNATSKSCINLDDLLNVEFARLEKNTNDFLSSTMEASKGFTFSMAQSTHDGVNVADKTGLADSVINFVDVIEHDSPFAPVIDKKSSVFFGSQLEKRAERNRGIARDQVDAEQVDNMYSDWRASYLAPHAKHVLANAARQVATNEPVQKSNNTNLPEEGTIDNNSILEKEIVEAFTPKNQASKPVKKKPDYTASNLIESTIMASNSAQSTTTAISTTDASNITKSARKSIFEMQKALLEGERIEQEQKNAAEQEDKDVADDSSAEPSWYSNITHTQEYHNQ